MQTLGISAYGGMAGRILRESLAPGTLLTGVVLGLALLLVKWITGMLPGDAPGAILMQVLLALALCRFALHGYHGAWSGTIFSTAGGSWLTAGNLTLRYLALSMAWVIPLTLLERGGEDPGAAIGAALMGMGGGKAAALGVLYLTATALTPPVFLIMAVGAESFSQVFQPSLWRERFSGRTADLALVYALYTGGVVVIVLLALPVTVALVLVNRDFGLFVGGIAAAYALGFAVTMLGRMCGFFAGFEVRGEDGDDQAIEAAAPVSPRGAFTTPAPAAISAEATSGGTPSPAGDHPVLGLVEPAPVRTASGLPPLLDAGARIDEIQGYAEQDPRSAIEALEKLRRDYAPHPRILHTLCLLQRREEAEVAMDTAKEALGLLLPRGNIRPAAEIFHAFLERSHEFALNHDQLLDVANQLRLLRHPASSARAYALILREDSWHTRAIKGMLQLAEAEMHQYNAPGEAHKIYAFLLEHCDTSPLVEYMRQGLEESERRMA